MDKSTLKKVTGCMACGQDHENLKLKEFVVPRAEYNEDSGEWDIGFWTYWYLCPVSEDPVTVSFEE